MSDEVKRISEATPETVEQQWDRSAALLPPWCISCREQRTRNSDGRCANCFTDDEPRPNEAPTGWRAIVTRALERVDDQVAEAEVRAAVAEMDRALVSRLMKRSDEATPKNEPQRRKLVANATLETKLGEAIESKDWSLVEEVRDALDDRAWYVAEERVETTDRLWKWLDQNGYPEAAAASFEVRELFFYPETEDTDGRLAARAEKNRTDKATVDEGKSGK